MSKYQKVFSSFFYCLDFMVYPKVTISAHGLKPYSLLPTKSYCWKFLTSLDHYGKIKKNFKKSFFFAENCNFSSWISIVNDISFFEVYSFSVAQNLKFWLFFGQNLKFWLFFGQKFFIGNPCPLSTSSNKSVWLRWLFLVSMESKRPRYCILSIFFP